MKLRDRLLNILRAAWRKLMPARASIERLGVKRKIYLRMAAQPVTAREGRTK